MAEISGTTVTLSTDDVQIDDLTANSLSMDKTIIDVTNKSSNGWREKIVGVKNWTMSATAMFDASATEGMVQAFADFTAGTVVALKFGPTTPTTGDVIYSGNAIVSTIEQTADFDSAVEYSLTFEGTGALTETITA